MTTLGLIHAAKIENSPRLQRVLRLLQDRGIMGATTWEIIQICHVACCPVNELRANGYVIDCDYEGTTTDRERTYRYIFRGKA